MGYQSETVAEIALWQRTPERLEGSGESARASPHRHGEAFVYAYVVEGNLSSKLDDEPARTFHQGDNWVEQPDTHHVLTENTSHMEPAKLLVVFISNAGDKTKIDDPHP